ncbi:hypothetical protein ABZ401_19240 [Streptomyces sp. NPDC005892]|uniref:hypothetical protein n=1 Tax=Streptomyces sp. NPDC005892 TaxID=3155593 RepID=UPI0033EE6D4C
MTTSTPPPTEPPVPVSTAVEPPPASEVPPTSPRKPLSPLLAGLLGLVVGAGLVGGAWAFTANSGDDKLAVFTLEGAFALTDGVVRTDDDGCQGIGGYDDIAEGTSVTVYDAAGGVAATGNLSEPEYMSGSCLFTVAVPDVPKGEKFYQVEVSHRGKVQLSSKEAEGGQFASTLG